MAPTRSCFTIKELALIVLIFVADALGHGRLMDPPSRASMWRMGFRTPKNYNDNQLYCGGLSYQTKMNGKCGVCGDPWGGRRDHEAGGRYATGTIAKTYSMGQAIEAKVDITANHKGHFTFKICPNNDPTKVVTQECLDRYPLMAVTQGSYTYSLNSGRNKMYKVKLQLPEGLSCSQCVLQWVYTAGNNWGVCPNGKGRLGCGPQEQFRGCADVAIEAQGSEHHPVTSKPKYPQQPQRPDAREKEDDDFGHPAWPESTHGPHHHPATQKPHQPKYPPAKPQRPVYPAVYPQPEEPNYGAKPQYPRNPAKPIRPKYPSGPKRPQRPKKPVRRPVYQQPRYPTKPRQPERPVYWPQEPKQPAQTTQTTPTTKTYVVQKPAKPSWQNKRPSYAKICKAVGIWSSVPGMNKWCANNCNRGYCPPSHCKC